MNSQFFFVKLRAVLEQMAPPDWFNNTRNQQHPLYLYWSAIVALEKNGGSLPEGSHAEDLFVIAQTLIDAVTLVTITKGNLEEIEMGEIESYGDVDVRSKIQSRIRNPDQFEDLFVELRVGAWYMTEGHETTPWELPGFPDMAIAIQDSSKPMYIECKRLTTNAEQRIEQIIKKANRQLKAPSEAGYGIAVIDLTSPVTIGGLTDEVPVPVLRAMDAIRRALSGPKNRSVSAVVAMWHDFEILRGRPEGDMVVLRRRSAVIHHMNPTIPLPADLPLVQGATVVFFILRGDFTELADSPLALPLEGDIRKGLVLEALLPSKVVTASHGPVSSQFPLEFAAMPDVPDVFTDQFAALMSPYGCVINFGLTRMDTLLPNKPPSADAVVRVHMSLEHLKVMTFLLHRKMVQYETAAVVDVQLPRAFLDEMNISQDEWEAFWRS